MYLMAPNQHVVALEPETGRELWNFDAQGDKTTGPRIVFGTDKAQIVALDAAAGKLAKSFGDNGMADFSPAIYEHHPHARYAITSPPVFSAIWRSKRRERARRDPVFGASGGLILKPDCIRKAS